MAKKSREFISLKDVVKYAVPQFNSDANQILNIIKYMESHEATSNIMINLPFNIPNPFEDSVRYRYVIAVEFFKKVSNTVRYAYFKDHDEMQQELLSEELQKVIDPSLNLRNTFAHVFISDYLNYKDLEISEIVNNLKALAKILEIYVAYVNYKSRST